MRARVKEVEPGGLKLYGRWRLTARHVKTGERVVKNGDQDLLSNQLPGPWRFSGKENEAGEVIIKEGKNLIVTVGKELIGQMLIDASGYDTGFTYQAIGTSTTAPAAGDLKLTVEAARKAITSRTRSGNEVTFSTFFTAAESTYNIKEAGVFGHSTASASANTGVLFSHWLVSFDNSGGVYDITIDYILTIGS